MSSHDTEDCNEQEHQTSKHQSGRPGPVGGSKKAGVDLSTEPGTPGKLWRALASGSREGLTTELLSEIQARGEMVTEIEAARTRFDATGNQNTADLAFLLLGLFCTSTSDSFEISGDILALLRAKKAGRTSPNEDDERLTRIISTTRADSKEGDY